MKNFKTQNLGILFKLLFFLILSYSCSFPKKEEQMERPKYLEEVYTKNIETGFLKTGVYSISKDSNDFKRILERTNERYFVDPNPILTVRDFSELEEYESQSIYCLEISLNEEGTKAWAKATDYYQGRKLLVIINNRLIHAPFVNSQVTGGVFAINSDRYDKGDIQSIEKELRDEMKE